MAFGFNGNGAWGINFEMVKYLVECFLGRFGLNKTGEELLAKRVLNGCEDFVRVNHNFLFLSYSFYTYIITYFIRKNKKWVKFLGNFKQ